MTGQLEERRGGEGGVGRRLVQHALHWMVCGMIDDVDDDTNQSRETSQIIHDTPNHIASYTQVFYTTVVFYYKQF